RERANGSESYRLDLPQLGTEPPAPVGGVASTDAAFLTGASWLGATAARQANRRHRDAVGRQYREAYDAALAGFRSMTRTSEQQISARAERVLEALRGDYSLRLEVHAALGDMLRPTGIYPNLHYPTGATAAAIEEVERIWRRRDVTKGTTPPPDPREADFLNRLRGFDV
ncbi:MAG TPA: hypothetical protein VGQ84_14680, partial [Gaiellaceae bacterium]|nr:hypothetical protein [Gaiellaceae bacterium]